MFVGKSLVFAVGGVNKWIEGGSGGGKRERKTEGMGIFF